ncbi:hypothetical protein FB106_10456 [Synechococcus sp. Ace-Pa]|nr:hypothetical protein FB106_10456 [Synechococcus sp. Ace-Pa]
MLELERWAVPLRARLISFFDLSNASVELPDLSHQTWVGLESFKTLSCCWLVAVGLG